MTEVLHDQLNDLFVQTLTHPERHYVPKSGGTNVDTIAVNGLTYRFDLSEGYPLTRSKESSIDYILSENFSFIAGDTNIRNQVLDGLPFWLDDVMKVHYKLMVKDGIAPEGLTPNTPQWRKFKSEVYVPEIKRSEEFAEKYANFQKGYWHQWRRRLDKPDGTQMDQLGNVINGIKNSPKSRRLILSAFNPVDLHQMPLPPCHTGFQVLVRDGKLDLLFDQRSVDTVLGATYNIGGYGFISHLLAAATDLEPGTLIWRTGNAHLYCGENERGEWYGNNIQWLGKQVKSVEEREDYRRIIEDIEDRAPPEVNAKGEIIEKDFQRLDHIPAALEMLAREPRDMPNLDVRLLDQEILNMDYNELKENTKVELSGYNPHPPIHRAMAVSEAMPE